MKIYLAGTESRMKVFVAGISGSLEGQMKVFMAESGVVWQQYVPDKYFKDAYILQSFYYANDFTEEVVIPNVKDFLLDSGAFTYMMQGHNGEDFDEYIERYAEFINRNNVDKFFEMDIDSIVGYKKVLQLRERLESLTGKQCIPVWHSTRGYDEFIKHCKEYPYVALGGIVGNEWNAKAEKLIPRFIRDAHINGAKIHGLGYTKLKKLKDFHFDSVDSTAWVTGNRFGYVYQFKNGEMTKVDAPEGMRLADARKVALHNYMQWVKFQKWAETNL